MTGSGRRPAKALLPPLWVPALLLVVILPLTGALPADEARSLAALTAPVLGFVVLLTVVAELCAGAGLFDAVADGAARLARGRAVALWFLVAAVATACTVVLSLDTTAVLLTPAVVAVARRVGRDPLPLALTVLALANTASLLLPVSNLTNLMAAPSFDGGYLGVMAAPAAAVVVVVVAALAVLHAPALRGAYAVPERRRAADPVLLRVAAVVVVLMGAGFAAGLPVLLVALAAVVALGTATAWRRAPLLVPVREMVPWRTVVVTAGLFAVVGTWHAHGLTDVLAPLVGTGDDAGSLAQVAAVGAASANAVNNLPAYLALAPTVAGDDTRLAALLVGVDAGPLVTPWASLATLLWLQQYRRHTFSAPGGLVRRAVVQGVVVAPLAVGAGILALVVGG
ncbi:SLC13 family permease [Krasilnikoviella flava]|uniref:Arsenical pump membrane protein n=1 Tax=Krasilnikoviella flava TaxID=526729 RepID=A0A1T5ISC6_9MICO|nr:SLC13 family permease [Krasilnikoviella flava]SKC42094.1 arsenical pump membrane protein [Krasilnikoviella flava]